MNEFCRIYRKRNVILVVIFVILSAGLFLLSCTTEKEITLTGYDLQLYIDGFDEYYENIKTSSEVMLSFDIYKDGFASENIRKTAEIYAKNDISNIRYGDNRGIILFIQYNVTDIFVIGFMIVIASDMLSERKKGLVWAIRCTKQGRTKLYMYRILILVFSALFMTVLLYSVNYIVITAVYGKPDISKNIQSLPEFMQCPYNITIRKYIIDMILTKAVAIFIISVVFYILSGVLGTAGAYTVLAVVCIAQIMLYNFIIPVSSVNHLRYINFYTILKYDNYYNECYFINIFSKAVSVISVMKVSVALAVVLFVFIGSRVYGEKYVCTVTVFNKISEKISKISEKVSFQKTLTGWELYKLLFKQGGAFFILAAFSLAFLTASKYNYIYKVDHLEKKYYEKYEGVITEETVENALDEYYTFGNQIEYFKFRLYQLSIKEQSDSVQKHMDSISTTLYEFMEQRDALSAVLDDMEQGLKYSKRTNKQVSLIMPHAYELLLIKDNISKDRASLFILIGIIGSVSGIFAYDKQSNMRNTLRSSYKGRKRLCVSKYIAVFLMCTVLCTSVHMIQFIQIKNLIGYNDISMQVQSLSFMHDFGLDISIRNYFVVMFAVRALFAFIIGLVCCIISRLCSDTFVAMGMSVFILVVPSLISQIIPGTDFVNAIYLIGGAGL